MSLPKMPPVVALVLPVLAASANAQIIVPVAQEREISARAELGLGGGPMSSESFQAPDFGPFNEVAAAREADVSQGTLADAGAWQDSSIGSSQIAARGSYFATAEFFFTEAACLNRCRFEFDVTQTCRYELTGSLEAYDFGATVVRIRNEATDAGVYSAATLDFSNNFPVDVRGVLYPGRYAFEVLGQGFTQDGSPAEYASGAYDLDLLLTPTTSNDCVATPNSSGAPAALVMNGEFRVNSPETYWYVVQGPPGNFGLLFYGDAMAPAMFGNGVLCVSSPLYRVPAVYAFNQDGRVSASLSYSGVPTGSGPGEILPGSTWTFQYWFRDVPQPGGDGWNTSTSATVTFGN